MSGGSSRRFLPHLCWDNDFGTFVIELSKLSKINDTHMSNISPLDPWSFITLQTKINRSSTPSHTSDVFVVFMYEGKDSEK